MWACRVGVPKEKNPTQLFDRREAICAWVILGSKLGHHALSNSWSCGNKWSSSGKRHNNSKDKESVVKTPRSASVVKISPKCSTSRPTGIWGMIILTFSDSHGFNHLSTTLVPVLCWILLFQPLHEDARTLSLKLPKYLCSGWHYFEKDPLSVLLICCK